MASVPRSIPKATNRRMMLIQSGSEISRSPNESPPTIKKKLCRLVSGSANASRALEATLASSRSKSAHRHPSILKKAPSGDGSTPCPSPAEVRRVQFQQHVTVFLMSDSGHVFCSESHRLTGDADENYGSARHLAAPGHYVVGGGGDRKSPRPLVLGCYDDYADDDDVDELSRVDFRLIDDPERGTISRFVLPLGADYKPEDIVVKANVGGNRIRLVANRHVTYPDRSMRIEQFSRRFNLPVQVDPYMVTARLDVRGNLTVEAPLLRISRRPDDGSGQRRLATLQDISNKTTHDLRR